VVTIKCEDRILDAITQLELTKIKLQKLYFEMRDPGYREYNGFPGADVSWDGEVLKFVIPEAPPRLKEITSAEIYYELESKWIGYMRSAFFSKKFSVKFEKAMCFVAIYLPYHHPWDVDNRLTTYILNGIKYLRIVKDDDSKHIAYSIMGERSPDSSRTEIYVIDYKKYVLKLVELGVPILP
jgi:hypothetical protein